MLWGWSGWMSRGGLLRISSALRAKWLSNWPNPSPRRGVSFIRVVATSQISPRSLRLE